VSQSTSSRRIATQPVTIPKAFCTRLSWCEANLQPSLIDNDRSWCKLDREAEVEPGG